MLPPIVRSRIHRSWPILRGSVLPALLLAGAFAPALLAASAPIAPRHFAMPAVTAPASAAPFYRERFIEDTPTSRSLHVPALTELANGDVLAVWKAAKSDLAAVTLIAATFDRGADRWGSVRAVTTSRRTEQELGRMVTTLTNPVLATAPDGTVSLLYVTAWFRWSTAALTVKTSTDHGHTWTTARRIVANPVGNLGTLVKGAPVRYTDGSLGVPAYQEYAGVLPQLLLLSSGGELLDKIRIHRGKTAMQPSLVPLDAHDAVAFMRNSAKGSMLLARTGDAGRTWTHVERVGLPNPNSTVMALRLRDGAILLVFNNSPSWREHLSLALSRDGGTRWKVLHEFEVGQMHWDGSLENFSYPYVIQTSDGLVHVAYVWRQRRVKHVSFNEAWIHERER